MKYVLLFILVFPTLSRGQSTVTGLGNYVIGITTPDSLSQTSFTEAEPSYVGGTIAVPCTHIRSFTSAMVPMAGVPVVNVVLVFYDNRLFKIACDYGDALKKAFLNQHGPGVAKPMSRFQVCTREKDKPLTMWGERWPGNDVVALVVYVNGYTSNCQREERARLIIVSQRMSALSSECDVKPADSLVDAFIKSL